jgi:maltose alpha-D-glucosyltransferase/alpha-amylase
MGDNIYLGDRNGVRTPMQWNGDRNAGFSTATPARLYSPVIMDPVWGYEAINVEAQQSDPSSLLSWMRNMIALRKLFRVFGRGSIEFLDPSNRKILAYLRQYEGEQVLCVANLSRFAQPVDLDLSKVDGMTPVEMLGYVEFPPIARQPYRLTLAPYSFLWLELQRRETPAEVNVDLTERAPLNVTAGWESILEGGRLRLETVELLEFLPKQRWFAGKSRGIKSVRIADWIPLNAALNTPSDASQSALVLVEVEFESGPPDLYFLPLAMSFGDAENEFQRTVPNAVIARVLSQRGAGLLYDGAFDDQTCALLFSLIENASRINGRHGCLRGIRGKAFSDLMPPAEATLQVRRSSAEQSNTSILFGDRFILKLFRRQEPGLNPDAEIGQYLTEKTNFNQIPPFAGSLEVDGLAAIDGKLASLAMLQGLVANEGDGWKWTLEELDRYYETGAPLSFPERLESDEFQGPLELSDNPPTQMARDHLGLYLEAGATLGRRTAELHLALAAPTDDPAFAPEALTDVDLRAQLAGIRQHASSVLDVLKERLSHLPDEVVEVAASVLSRRRQILDHFGSLNGDFQRTQKIRIHGDYHLGQVLRVKTDFVILDFEGEPARPLAVRRAKQCALKDVAGMLRSFGYAAYAGLMNYTARHPEDVTRLEPWAQLWERSAGAEFLRAYRGAAQGADFLPPKDADFRKLLNVFLLDKALYEVLYELNSRPAWVRIPLMGIISLLP